MDDKSIFSQKMHGQICNVCGAMLGFCQNGVLVCSECAFLVCRTCYEFICEAGNHTCPKCFTSYGSHGAEGLSASSSGDQISKQSWEVDFKSIHHSKFSRKQAANELLCSEDYQNKQSDSSYSHSRMFSTPLDVLARSNPKDGRVCAEPPAHPLSKRAASFPPPGFRCGKKNRLLSFSVPCSPVIGTAADAPVQADQAKYPDISWVLSSCSLGERLLQWKLEQEKTYKTNESTKELLDMDAFGSFKGLEYENSKVPWVLSSRSLRERLLQWKLLREKIPKRSKSKKESLAIDAFGSFKGLEYEKSEEPWLLSSRSLRERLLRWKRAREKNSRSSTKMESCEVNGYGPFEKVELDCSVMDNERRQPLSRKVRIHASKMNPYRIIIIFRLLIMTFFFRYRLVYPVRNAYGLWLASVLCELWFSLSWLLEQLPKWQPVNRETYPARLCLRYNPPGKESELACIDVFISTVDPVKEPPIATANTVLSVLSVDYPVDKVSCYVSDDGTSLLILETLLETCEFARKWVPFCKRFNIEPRSPEHYFSQKVDHLKYSMFPTFPTERRAIKRLYEEFKVLISDLVFKFKDVPSCGFSMKDGTPWPGNNTQDHPGMIQILVGRRRPHGNDDYELPQLVYVSREKHPSYWHNEKAGAMNALVRVSAVITNGPYILNLDCNHYINNSKAFLEAMCFMMDPNIMDKVCYVQFPQRFDSINPNDHQYANHNTVFYDITMKGLDGIQGPLYVGTGCFFNRKALYGYEPKWCGMSWCWPGKKVSNEICSYHSSSHVHSEEGSTLLSMDLERQYPSVVVGLEKYFGQSAFFLSSTLVKDGRLSQSASTDVLLKEAIHVLSCDYEDNTAWGREIGWIYGSLTSDILTGFKMHLRGWRSMYCMPSCPAFRGSAPTNLSDRLSQVLRWAFGSVEILFSKRCPVWYGYGGRLKLLQRIAYINATIYPLTSIPLVTYCTLPAVCLLTGKFIIPPVSILWNVWLPLLFVSVLATGILEIRWGDVSIEEWWRNEQFWAIAGVSSHLFAVFLGMIKAVVGMTIISTVMTKKLHEDKFMERHALKWTALLIVPTTLILINLGAMVAGAFLTACSGYGTIGLLFAKLFFAFWVVLHLYPFLKGLLVRQQQIPYGIIVWPLTLAILFSISWVRFNPFTHRFHGPDLQECGINC